GQHSAGDVGSLIAGIAVGATALVLARRYYRRRKARRAAAAARAAVPTSAGAGKDSAQDTMSFTPKGREANAKKDQAETTQTAAPSSMPPQETCGCIASSQANCQCEGRTRRQPPSAVTASRMSLTMTRPTAPPTAPSGESVDTESKKASPATTSSVMST